MPESADSQMDRLKSPLEGKLEAPAHALEAIEPGTAGTAISSTAPGGKREPMATGEEDDNADSGGDGDVTVPKVFHTGWRLHGLTAVYVSLASLASLEELTKVEKANAALSIPTQSLYQFATLYLGDHYRRHVSGVNCQLSRGLRHERMDCDVVLFDVCR